MKRAGLRILLTNNSLGSRAGSELYVRDLALALMRRGHFPVAYSTVLGDVAAELRSATVPVIDDLRALNAAPDVIHGQHHLDAMTAMLQFPQVPAIYMCHGWSPWEERPPLFPSIRRYVAVDDLCRERLLTTAGIDEERVDLLYNFVDLERFKLRAPLPPVPESALIFSNSANEGSFVGVIRDACHAFGIGRVSVAGASSGNTIAQPERMLGGYDIVFAKARCALEAMAVGCATIVADFSGLGGMVDTGNMLRLRRLNFGVRTMQAGAITREGVLAALQRYNPSDARSVAEWIRSEVDMSAAVDRLLEIYAAAIDAPAPDGDAHTLLAGASAYLRELAPVIKARGETEQRARNADEALHIAESRSLQTAHELEAVSADRANLRAQLERSTQELQIIHRSRAWRAISRYRNLRARLLQALQRAWKS